MKRLGARYRRNAQTLKRKQDPAAQTERAGRTLEKHEAKAAAGELVLDDLDECRFSPTLPVGSNRTLTGRWKPARHEPPVDLSFSNYGRKHQWKRPM